MGLTFFEKVWNDHVIEDVGDGNFLIHIDRNFMHELSGAVSLKAIDEAGFDVRNPELTFGVVEHAIDTHPGRKRTSSAPGGNDFLREFYERIRHRPIRFFDYDDRQQGIVHVIAPELGIALPGETFVCGDSHTCTVGGIGAFAWGIGSTDGEHVLATQTLVITKPKTMRVDFQGRLAAGVFAKDMILGLIGKYGAGGGVGYAIEYAGETIESLPMDGRLTLCNMAVEFGGRTGMVAPDQITFDYLNGRPFAPAGEDWLRAVAYWRLLRSDRDARYDKELELDCNRLAPQVTWGTSPSHVIGVDDVVPDAAESPEGVARASHARALEYVGLEPGTRLLGEKIQGVFIGSCTNSRLDDLREAASVLRGRKIADGLMALCVPGSTTVKRAAEQEGLDRVFKEAGFEWREAGCSLCASGAIGGEAFPPGSRTLSTTNRNFENRQGRGVRSHLASPATVAASAVAGRIADAREYY
ncbi:MULTISPECIES: 3-isopropylmalate dehydratase large subunit [unclassified Sphingomonas]|uniref:3-isopropylmalate dehydratase large subunit n=1 Tax=unclassified Sphingomonas TaxID=196159 RepID=UPI0006F4533B|nr:MULTISPECIES: 3-isopropylmalate dehydratase large subunit [unclassified Sphingomonas]KQX19108.1 3-isopropylmalate dehydratase [Sphingomonas sp. Root1294]KQY65309.1 3-isopropylmalate dehydratase [Sphingomonas sp. Root50]KRB95396.1 3-isopropylmalate dehydratase [Sphingomonas sp. Root720]